MTRASVQDRRRTADRRNPGRCPHSFLMRSASAHFDLTSVLHDIATRLSIRDESLMDRSLSAACVAAERSAQSSKSGVIPGSVGSYMLASHRQGLPFRSAWVRPCNGLTKGVSMARFTRRALVVALAVFAVFGIAVASAAAPTITGYPNQINKIDLNGYTLQTTYSLGRNAGAAYVQTYHSGTVDAGPVGVDCGGPCFSTHYTAMPVGNKMVMVTWFNGGVGGDGAITDVFLFNFQTGVVSDVAPDPVNGPESLGTVDVLAQGATRIPPP